MPDLSFEDREVVTTFETPKSTACVSPSSHNTYQAKWLQIQQIVYQLLPLASIGRKYEALSTFEDYVVKRQAGLPTNRYPKELLYFPKLLIYP